MKFGNADRRKSETEIRWKALAYGLRFALDLHLQNYRLAILDTK